MIKQYVFEIFRQKRRILSIILTLLLFNFIISAVVSVYQRPLLTGLQTNWSDLRRKAATAGKFDATTLYQQGAVDLEKLKEIIPEKRQFARILSDLLEAAASNAVEVGAISYKPLQVKGENLLSYQLSFSVNGGYAAVKSYLADLQNNPELIVVDTVVFSNRDLFVESVAMDLHITVYLREGV